MTRKNRFGSILVLCLVILVSQTYSETRGQRQNRLNNRPQRYPVSQQSDQGSIPSRSRSEFEAMRQKMQSRHQQQATDVIPLDVRPLDVEGRPVVGTLYGTHLLYNDTSQAKDLFDRVSDVSLRRLIIRDGRIGGEGSRGGGNSKKKRTTISIPPSQDKAPLYVVHREKQLCALREITTAEASNPIIVPLEQACRIIGTVTSSQMSQQGRPLPWVEVNVYWQDYQPITYRTPLQETNPMMPSGGPTAQEHTPFTLYLPPGDYRLEIRAGDEIPPHKLSITVNADQRQIDLGSIDMPASPFLAQYGQAAPECSVKTWPNGRPVLLSDLVGRPIILFFFDKLERPTEAGGHSPSSSPKPVSMSRTGGSSGGVAGGGGGGAVGDIQQLRR
ncbi:hypothetical protein ACFL6U_27555, partial [Planctomycetota bacterium]